MWLHAYLVKCTSFDGGPRKLLVDFYFIKVKLFFMDSSYTINLPDDIKLMKLITEDVVIQSSTGVLINVSS